ncbi:MAG: class I SAM-dependent methyltransferase [Acidobacteria bacterium]|nr:class I SAM-dependent methyltransferase [Acidobacteriota bacterium]
MQSVHFSTRTNQFEYFDEVLGHPRWRGKKILDFGGNVGNFLIGASDEVRERDYWCMEVHADVVREGQTNFPRAHFVHFDRYSSEFNPAGVRHQPVPDDGTRFDFILAFSVFTHIDRSEMLELATSLRALLAPRGVFAFTFTDPTYDKARSHPDLAGSDVRKSLGWANAKDLDALVERAMASPYCVAIGDQLFCEPGEEISHQKRVGAPWESYCAYYTADCMRSLFPGCEIHDPVKPAWQHCCVVRR